MRALKSKGSPGGPALLRRGLVVFQFGLSIFMLVGTLTVYKQLRYVQSASLGFDKERVMAVPVQGEAAERVARSKMMRCAWAVSVKTESKTTTTATAIPRR